LFLEDMLTPVFSSDSEQPLVVSSIRGTKRPYESAFHAAVVAAVVVQMYTALDMPALAAGFVDGLAKSVAEFQITPQHLTARGRELLAELAGVVTTVADIRTGHADSVRSP
jgi:hemoglobin-like flavoprotein